MPNKSLGQHWLKDKASLQAITDLAQINTDDTVLEIGPGQGDLTSLLLNQASQVIAVEFDAQLAAKLPQQFPGKNLQVINKDVLQFDLNQLPSDYKVVANLPYYITSKIIQHLATANNPPNTAVLLVQKEVAQRLAARPGNLSVLAIATQIYYEVGLGPVIAADLFIPPPKVDSQAVVLQRRNSPIVSQDLQKAFFKIVKVGFAAKRKKLRSSLSAGLHLSKAEAHQLLAEANIDANKRAQDLDIADWIKLAKLKL